MYEFVKYKVKDAMTPSPLTTTPDTTLRELEKIFETHDFNGIPVLDDQQRLVGIVTKFDLLRSFILTPDAPIPHYQEIMEQPAWSVMTTDPVTVTPELPLTRLLELLVELQTKSLPVIQNRHLVGIISREDVLEALHRATTQRPTPQEAQS